MPTSLARRLVAPLAALVLGLAATSALADNETVTTGNLNWSTVKLYGATAGVDRTFVGFETRNTQQGHQNMTLSPNGAMWGTTISPSDASGTAVTWNFPVAGGVFDPATAVGTVALNGRLQGVSTNISTNIGFNYTLSIDNPVIVFDGTNTARLFADGTKYGGTLGSTVTYDRSAPLFTLAFADMTHNADGTTTVSMVPTVVTDIYGGFPAGSGPDRTPNTFGGFTLTFGTVPGAVGPKGDPGGTGLAGMAGVPGAIGPIGPVGPVGPRGKAGKAGKAGKTAKIRSVTLRRAPFASRGKLGVELRSRMTGKVVGTGTVQRHTLRVKVAQGTKLKGTWTLRRTAKKVASARSVRIAIG